MKRKEENDGGMDDSGDEVRQHESELSETSDIEMMDIDDDDDIIWSKCNVMLYMTVNETFLP